LQQVIEPFQHPTIDGDSPTWLKSKRAAPTIGWRKASFWQEAKYLRTNTTVQDLFGLRSRPLKCRLGASAVSRSPRRKEQRLFNPWLTLSLKAFQVGVEAQSVIALRMLR